MTSTNDSLANIMQTQGLRKELLFCACFASSNISLDLHNKSNVRLGVVQQVYTVRVELSCFVVF